jgi:DNA primase
MKADFDEIKRTTDLRAVVERYGIALKREGKDWRGKCPFHDDQKRPNFIVSPDKGLWRCPACGAAGNVIQFVARMESLTEREAALKLLCAVPGVGRGSELPSPQPSKIPVPPKVAAMLLARVASFYTKALSKDRAGLEYLKTRGLDDPAMLETFAVGYCNGSMREALSKGGEVVEQLKALGVLNEKGNEVFYGRVVVPIYDAAGNVAGLYGRRVGDDEPRHLYLRGERRGVFNGQATKAHRSLILVESIFDAMSLWKAGFRNAIALCGADGWTKDHAALVSENNVTEIYLAMDNDEAGRAGAERLTPQLAELGAVVHRVQWPEGVKDANAFFSSRSGEDFAALLKAAKPPTEPAERLEKEEIKPTAEGFAVNYGPRHYELCAMDKPSPSRLKATIRAVTDEAGRFAIDTVDFYAMRSKRSFITEAARLFREPVEVIEADVNRLTLAAENFLAQRSARTGPSVAVGSDAERAEGMRLARNPDLIGELQRDLDKLGIIGERTNRLLLYLAMTSRKMEEPLAVQILSSSGAGKSHLQDAVLSLCPEEDLIKLTSLTDRALFYKGEDSLRHKAIAIAEVAGAEGARYALRNLISDKKLVIESTVKNPLTGRLETQVNTVNGPTAVFETTTNPDTDAETKSRYLLLSVDESPEQTRAIMEAQRQSHTLEGRKRRHQRSTVLARQHAFQRLLRPLVVVNPFEPLLDYGDGKAGALPLRRDHPKYLNLILVVTFLYQHQRAVKHDAELGDYIETTLEDIAIANELAAELFGQPLDELSFPSRELLRLIGDYVSQRAQAENKTAGEIEWTRRELREAIQWTEARLRLHLGELVRLECIAPLSGKFGSRFRYSLLMEPAEIEAGERLAVALKSVEQLRHEANLAGIGPNRARGNGNLAATSQAPNCEVEPPAKPHEHRTNGHHGPNLAGAGGKRIYTLHPNGRPVEVHS